MWWTKAGLTDAWCISMGVLLIVELSASRVLVTFGIDRSDLALDPRWRLIGVDVSSAYLVATLEFEE